MLQKMQEVKGRALAKKDRVRRTISYIVLVPTVFTAGFWYAHLKAHLDLGNPWLSLVLFLAIIVGIGVFAVSILMVAGSKKGLSIAWYLVGLAVVVVAILLGQQIFSAIGWKGLLIVLGAIVFVVGFWVLTTWGPFRRLNRLREKTRSASRSTSPYDDLSAPGDSRNLSAYDYPSTS